MALFFVIRINCICVFFFLWEQCYGPVLVPAKPPMTLSGPCTGIEPHARLCNQSSDILLQANHQHYRITTANRFVPQMGPDITHASPTTGFLGTLGSEFWVRKGLE